MGKRVTDQHIFSAVLQVVTDDGLQATTTRRIAEAADINEVTLFRRFGTKAELMRAALRSEVDSFVGVGLEPTGDIRADLET